MGPRRTHRKSRNGCPECKSRRLKVFFPPSPILPFSALLFGSKPVANLLHSVTNDILVPTVLSMLFIAAMLDPRREIRTHQLQVFLQQLSYNHNHDFKPKSIILPRRRQ